MSARAVTAISSPNPMPGAASRRANARLLAAERRQPHLPRLLCWLLSGALGGTAGLAFAQAPAGALPTGGRVVVGAGQVQQTANLMLINQTTQRLGMDWQSFNIGSGATVEFVQPSAGSIALNRVLGNSGSEIYGRLKANGQVFLTNPNGVLFAPGAKVDVGGLVASTLDLTQDDFAAGRFVFSGNGGNGAVVNQGTLRASAGGYLALFGNRVDNQGEIAVDAGNVVLASGRAVTVSISGSGLISAVVTPGTAGSVANSGSILADGGVVRLSAASAQDIAASLVNNSGLIRANTLVERGGEIWITGDNVANSGQLVASAPAGGDGGRIMVIGDMQRGSAQIAGMLDVSSTSGNSGFIETSAARVHVADDTRVSAGSPNGRTGTWLIDPTDFNIAATGGDMTGATLGAILSGAGGINFLIASNAGASGTAGNINVNDAVTWDTHGLTFNAQNNVNINSAMTGTSGATLLLQYGQSAVASGNLASYNVAAPVSLPAGASFFTKLGSNGTTIIYTVVNDLAGLQAIDGNAAALAGNYAVGAALDASASAAANGGLGFNPIGNEAATASSTTNSFSGQFDGLGNTISGLTIARPTSLTVGLFANTNNAQIRNLTLTGSAITGSQYAGGVVGFANAATTLSQVQSSGVVTTASVSTAYAGGLVGQFATTGTITQSITAGTVTGRSSAGGLVGYGGTGTVSNSSSSANVTATAGDAGGLMGRTGGAVSSSSASGTVSGTSDVGGLIGIANGTGAVTASSATGSVTNTVTTGTAGGLIGSISSGAVTDGTASGAVSGGTSTGGLIGSFSSSTASITTGTATGNVTGSAAGDTGGLVGIATGTGSLSNSSATGNVSAPTNGDTVGGLAGQFSMTGGIVNSSSGKAASTVSGGNYTGGVVGWYSTAAALVNNPGGGQVIAFRGASVSGGTFYSGGIVGQSVGTSALTGLSSSATVTGGTFGAGGLAGYTAGNVTNGTATGAITGGGDVGGLVGQAAGTSVSVSGGTASGRVINTTNAGTAGGLVGYASNASVAGSNTSGDVSGGLYTGGLIGRASGGVSSSGASGAVSSTNSGASVGGLVGYLNGGSVISGSAVGNVSSTSTGSNLGGLVGYFDGTGSVTSSSAAGSVAGGANTGGLIGYFNGSTGSITGGTATGAVSGSGDVGGLVGQAAGTGAIANSSAAGNVTGLTNADRVGGLAGNFSMTGGIVNSSAGAAAAGATPATTVGGGVYTGGVVGYYSSSTALVTDAVNTIAFRGASVSGGAWAGGIVGYSAGTSALNGLTANAQVTATGSAGGLAGRIAASATGNTATGNVSAGGDAGGLFGRADGTGAITGSVTSGSVTTLSVNAYNGGIVGYMTAGSVVNATATGNVTGGRYTGGVIGALSGTGVIQNVRAEGSVSATGDVGGIVGWAGGSGSMTGAVALGNVSVSSGDGQSVGGAAGYFAMSGGMAGIDVRGSVLGGANTGGVVGYYNTSTALVNGSNAATAITSTASAVRGLNWAGGIVGYSDATSMTGFTSAAAVTVTGVYAAGGIAGRTAGTMSNSSASGAVVSGGDAGGLIGRVEGTGGIQNSSTATTSTVAGVNDVGGLVGQSSAGSFTDVTARGTVTGANNSGRVGGLVGYMSTGSITRGNASGAVTGGNNSGGLVGGYFASAGTIDDSHATGNVAGGSYAGGLIGDARGTYTNVSATGNVTGIDNVGGLIGSLSSAGSVSTATASGNVTSISSYAGGLIGVWQNSTAITDSRATGNVTGNSTAGGLVGYAYSNSGGINNSRADGQVVGVYSVGGLVGQLYYTAVSLGTAYGKVRAISDGTVYVGGLAGIASGNTTGNQITNSSAFGTVFADSPYASAGGLVGYAYGMAITGSHASGSVTLRDSYNINSGSNFAGGLAGYYYGAGISNSTASGEVNGLYYTGGLVGYYEGNSATAALSDSSATGNVTGTYYVGGLVGIHYYTSINNSQARGNVVATDPNANVGGLVGFAYGYYPGSTINDSSATGNVSGGQYAGGLIGYWYNGNSSTTNPSGITNGRASGNVSGAVMAGGLVGYFTTSYTSDLGIVNGLASGSVSARTFAGGLVGQYRGYNGISDSTATGNVQITNASSDLYLGGLVGHYLNNNSVAGSGQIRRSYATGTVSLVNATNTSSTDIYAGGLVGYLDGYSVGTQTVSDSFASGAVTVSVANSLGRTNAGGLLGTTDGSFSRVYSTGVVQATGAQSRNVGGLVGSVLSNSVTATSAFWDTTSSGQASSVLGTAATPAEMRAAATFSGWDIASAGGSGSVWRIYEGLSTPLLRGFLTAATVTLADVSKTYDGQASLGGASVLAGGLALTRPERILVGGLSADAGSYTLSAANLYSVHNGYDLTVAGTSQLTVNRKALTLDALAADKPYDSTLAAATKAGAQPGGLVAGEDLLFQPGSGFGLQFIDKNVGAAKVVSVAGSYTWADGTRGKAANYVLPTGTSTTAAITPAPLTAGSFAATARTYDGTTSVVVSATTATLSGVLGTDTVNVDLSGVASGTIASKNVGTGKAVTVLGASLSGADAGNYSLVGIGGVTVDITPRAATINGITTNDRTYNSGVYVSLNTSGMSLSGVLAGDLVQPSAYNASGRVADKNVGNAKPVTVTNLTLRGPDATNYTAQQGSVTNNTTPYPLTLYAQRTSQTDRVYDGTTSASITLPVYWYGSDNIVVSNTGIAYDTKNVAYSSGAVTSKTITVSGLSISGTDAANYALQNTTATTSGTISPKPLPVTGVAAVNRAYDGTRDVVVSVASAAVDVSGKISGDDLNVVIPSSGAVTGQMINKNAGTAKAVTVPGLTLTGNDAGNYTVNSASNGVTVDIARKGLTAVYTALDKVYDANPYPLMSITSADIVAGDSVRFFADQSYCGYCGYSYFTTGSTNPNSFVASKNAGTAKSVITSFNGIFSTDAANYNLLNPSGSTTASITPRPVTLVFNGVSKVYDGTTGASVALNRGSSGIYGGDTLATSQTATYTDSKNVGTGKPIAISGITFTGADAANYTPANSTASTTGAVTARPVTLTGITATDRAYDGTTTVVVTAGTITSSGFLATDTVTVSQPGGGLTAGIIPDKNVGTAKPVTVTGLTLTGGDAGNYAIDIAGSGITVNIGGRPLTPAYAGVNRVYNGGVTASVTASSADIVAGDTVAFTQQAVFTGGGARNVGTAKPISISNIALGGASAANYSLTATTASATANITPKAATIDYAGVNRVYNGLADTSVGVTGSSLQVLAGDLVGYTQTAALVGDGAAGTSRAVSVSGIALVGQDAANYSLSNTTASTNANILRRPLGVTGITATGRVYDGTTTVAVTVTGASVDTSTVIAADAGNVSVTLPTNGISSGTLADRHVGIGKTVSITGLDIAGSAAGNYTLIGAAPLTVNITSKALTATYSGVDKVYDGTATAAVLSSSSDIYAIDAALVAINAIGTFTGTGAKNVGTGKTLAVRSGFLTGASRDDYTLLDPTGSTTANITQRTLTASYASGQGKVYDGGTGININGQLSNLVSGDSVSVTQTAAFAGAGGRNVGNGKPIDISGLGLQGTDKDNYTLTTTTASTVGNITPKQITVGGLANVVATDRPYNAQTQVVVTVPAGVTLVPNSSDIVSGDQVTIVVPGSGVTTGSMANKNVGTGKTVTVDGLSLTGTDGGNYAIAGTAGITVNITAKPLAASYVGVNRAYDGTVAATVGGTSADIIAGDSVFISGTGNFTGTGAKNVGIGKAVDVLTARLSSTDAANYTLTNTTGGTTADITPRSVTASYIGNTKVYDGGTSAPVTGSAAFVAGDDIALSQTAVFTGAGARNVASNKPIQVSAIALSGGDAANYSLTNAGATTTGRITPKPIGIIGLTGVTANDRAYDGSTAVVVNVLFTGTISANTADIVVIGGVSDVVGVTVPSSGTTTGEVANKNVGSSKQVAVTGLALTGADAGNYTISATNGVTVNITPRALTATYAGVSRVYDGTTAASVTGSSADIVSGDAVLIAGTGVYTGTGARNVGTGKPIDVQAATLASADAANYALQNPVGSAFGTITPRSVSGSYIGGTRVYDGTTAAPVTSSLVGAIAGDAVTLTQSAQFTGIGARNVGTGKLIDVSAVALTGADATNYTLTTGGTSTTGSITKRPLGVTGLTGVTATDRIYDGTRDVTVNVASNAPVAANPGDIVAGDVVSITSPGSGLTTGVMADKNVGSAKPVVVAGLALGGADAGNYSVGFASGVTVNIAPRSLTSVYTGISRVYDGSTAASVTGASSDVVAGDALTISGSGVFTGTGARNAGTGKAILVQSAVLASTDAANYSLLNPTGSATADITRRPVSTQYTGTTKVYDGTDTAPVTYTSSGLINGDAVAITQTALFSAAGGRNVGINKAVQVSAVTLSGNDAGNYSLVATSATTTASITPRPLNVGGLSGITAVNREYNGTRDVTVNVTGTPTSATGDIIVGDDVTVSFPVGALNAGTMLDKNAGTAKAVALTGLTLTGVDAANYAITGTAGLTVNIAPRPVALLGLSATNRSYDATTVVAINTSAGSISGKLAGDDLTLQISGVTGTMADKHAGTAKPVTVAGLSLAGADSANYTGGTGAALSVDIAPRTLAATVSTVDKVYDGSTRASVILRDDRIAGDTLGIAANGAFADKNVGNLKSVTASSLSLSGPDAGDYLLATTAATTTASITPRPVSTFGIAAFNKVYDGNTAATVSTAAASLNGLVPGDTVSIGATGAFGNKSAGTGKSVTLVSSYGGADLGNYLITDQMVTTASITPKALTISGITAAAKVYDGSAAATINAGAVSLNGLVPGDALTVGATGAFDNKNVGAAKTVTLAGTYAGADVGNYIIAGQASTTASITPKTVTVSGITAVNKVYDATTVAAVSTAASSLVGLVAGDALTVSVSGTFDTKDAGNSKTVSLTSSYGGADLGNYTVSGQSGTTATITPAPATFTAGSLSKVYGETVALSGSAFSALGLVANETIGQVTLTSAGVPTTAGVTGSPYAIGATNARGGTFNPGNYAITYRFGQLTVTPRPLTVATNSVVRFADEPNPTTYGFSSNVGGLVGSDSIASVLQAAPAGSTNAPGGSVFDLVPSGAVFGVGTASNYALRYGSGLLVVLPKPPRLGDTDGNAGNGDVNFAIQIDAAEVKRATDELDRVAQLVNSQLARPGVNVPPGQQLPVTLDAPAEIALLLAGDSRSITLPMLLKLPLISFDPQLRRLILGNDAAGTP